MDNVKNYLPSLMSELHSAKIDLQINCNKLEKDILLNIGENQKKELKN